MMNAETLKKVAELQAATIEARKRSGNPSIAARVKAGRVQLVTVVYDDHGGSGVAELSGWMSHEQALDALAAL